MIVIGVVNKDKCPASSNIPIFLIVEGVIGIISKILSLLRDFLLKYFKVDPILSVIGLVEFAFFICGSVWVFSAFEPRYNPALGELYCNKTTYLFALIIICCIYIIIAVVVFTFLCISVMICLTVAICGGRADGDVETAAEMTPLPTNDHR
ncbi:hypothetical protein NQ315_004724 [Exocentrus adspersus]|uniref:MARVEL domain-containing protein n=1 Tax=Exocentrus adspersus TaxID=1586481 RepID=A0AAV8W3J4_9CUCU|nr:hypothetical protein NQ315_004724 [Exocentrus adspersus]